MSSLKLLSCNIEGEKHLEQVIPFLTSESADIICLQEVLEKDVPMIREAVGMTGEFVPCMRMNEENYSAFPVGSVWGLLLLTNQFEYTIHVTPYVKQSEGLPNFGYKNPNAANRVLLVLELTKDDKSFRIITTHFTWTPNGQSSDLQKEHLDKMLAGLALYTDFVLCGDFNAPRGGEIWGKLASLYHDNIPENILSTLDPTFHRAKDIQLVVDGLFSTPEYIVSDVRLKDGVSDHMAIIATVTR